MKTRVDRFNESPIIVVGSGIAGLLLSIELADEGRDVILLTRGRLEESNTAWAQGGLAAVTDMNTADTKEQHLADTIAAGDGLTDPIVAERIIADGAKLVNSLALHGVNFDADSLALEGGHRLARVLHSADATGRAIVDALISAVKQRKRVKIVENCLLKEILVENDRVCGIIASCAITVGPKAVDVATSCAATSCDATMGAAFGGIATGETAIGRTSTGGIATGVSPALGTATGGTAIGGTLNQFNAPVLRTSSADHAESGGAIEGDIVIEGHIIVLATGGLGQIYSRTTNPSTATGDGIAAAFRAGAYLADLEFVQFHPTALHLPGSPAYLISEAARGAGAVLLNKNAERFMHKYHPSGELATRDIVSRAIFSNMMEEKTDCAWLDMRPIGAKKLLEQFPNIVAKLRTFGIDPLVDTVPVSPAAHYFMGGILTDEVGRTTLSGLFAIGECASTGLHGANRLASNSLLEGGVMALKLTQLLAKGFEKEIRAPLNVSTLPLETSNQSADSLDLNLAGSIGDMSVNSTAELTESFRRELFGSAGLVRSKSGLTTLINTYRYAPQAVPFTLGLLIANSALLREESRGAHWRSDYPVRNDGRFNARLVVGKEGASWLSLNATVVPAARSTVSIS